MLKLKNITKTYVSQKSRFSKLKAYQKALKKVNAHFENNQFITIFGPSGSGKTTLLNILAGLDTADKGSEIIYQGNSTNKFNEANWDSYRNNTIGYIFQEYNLIEKFSVLDNVMMGLAFSKVPKKVCKKLSKEALEKVGMLNYANKSVYELSGGQRQLVAIARAIVKDPQIVLADEPTGALDSKNSQKIMDVLKKISKDRLIIMATHDKELAKKYSTQIYSLNDGVLSEPQILNPENAEAQTLKSNKANNQKEYITSSSNILNKNKVKIKKSKLSLGGALTIAFKNFKAKKVKSTAMLLASSLGIIAIGVILSLSNGTTQYIKNEESTTLSQYPLYFAQNRDLTKVDSFVRAQTELQKNQEQETITKSQKKEGILKKAQETNKIALENNIANMLSTSGDSVSGNKASTINDVTSLKKYLDKNPSNFNSYVESLEYTFRTSPVIFIDNSNGCEEVYPSNGIFGSLGSGSGGSADSKSTTKASSSSNAGIASAFNTFNPLPEKEEIYRDDDCLLAGHWPENAYEAILVLNDNQTVNDTMLYNLGIRDFKSEIEPLIEKYNNNERVEYPGQYDLYEYGDFIDKKLKVINPSDCYVKDPQTNLFVDMSSDMDFMKSKVDNSNDLTIVGIVLPKKGSKAAAYLNAGVQFSADLTKLSIEQTKNSEVVQAQLANPNVDVLSGETFDYLAKADKIFDRKDFSKAINFNINMLLDSIKINPEALDFKSGKQAVKESELSEEQMREILIKLLQDKDFQEFIYDLTKEGQFDERVYQIMSNSAVVYMEYLERCSKTGEKPLDSSQWFAYPNEGYIYVYAACEQLPEDMMADAMAFIEKHGPKIVEVILTQLEEEINQIFKDVVVALFDDSGPELIEIDTDKFSKALKINITMDDINQICHVLTGASKHTYKGNLADFGYDDLTDPITLTIYPKDASSKAEIISIIDTYNTNAEESNNENLVVTYTDDSGTMINMAIGIVSAISAVLIFFIFGSLMSSIILIGVVFGLSTIQRRKEIGILRALGARKVDILKMFNCETLLLGFLAGAFGVAVSLLICAAINSVGNLTFDLAVLPVWGGLGLILGCAFATFIAGFVPSSIASKKNPVDAIRRV